MQHKRNYHVITNLYVSFKYLECYQCGDEAAGIPCTPQQVYDPAFPAQDCPAGLQYCMTDVHSENGNEVVYKR